MENLLVIVQPMVPRADSDSLSLPASAAAAPAATQAPRLRSCPHKMRWPTAGIEICGERRLLGLGIRHFLQMRAAAHAPRA